jgi:hypothetical protein
LTAGLGAAIAPFSNIPGLPDLSPQEETENRSNCDNGSQDTDLVPTGTYDGTDYIGGDEDLKSEEKVRAELLSYGLTFPNLVRDSRPGLGTEKADHRFEDAPDDHECAQDADGKINGGDGPIKERHTYIPPSRMAREWILPRPEARSGAQIGKGPVLEITSGH